MKKFLLVVGLILWVAAPAVSQAQEINTNSLDIQTSLALLQPQGIINWKVGDTASFDVSIGSFGKMGTNVKTVTKDEGEALWVLQDMNLSAQKQKVEALISKTDGKILKLIVNGQEQQVPNDPIEIISQDYTEITVPAGKFQTVHIVAKSKQVSKLEVWANPRDTVMEGTIKQIANTGMFDLTMELTSFKRAP